MVAADSNGRPTDDSLVGASSHPVDESRAAESVDVAASAIEAPLTPPPEKSWVDRMHDRFTHGVDGSAQWFDGFFGETRYDDTTEHAYGRASLQVGAKEYDGLWVRGRVRARFPLPNASHRFNAIVGRGDPDDIIEDNNGYSSLVPSGGDDGWLAGLGYTPPWGKSGRVTLGAGVRIDWPLDPYVQARYKLVHNFSQESLVRVRETVFWRNSEGLGSSTSVDLERRLGETRLLRWANLLKISEITEGMRYDSRVILYQNLGTDRAVSWMIGLRGESEAVVPVREYGGLVTLRQRMQREWLFGELLVGVFRLREDDWSDRRTGLFIAVGMEIFFGDPPAASTNDERSGAGGAPR